MTAKSARHLAPVLTTWTGLGGKGWACPNCGLLVATRKEGGPVACPAGCVKRERSTTDTVRRVARPRGEMTPQQQRQLARLREKADAAEADYRAAVLTMLTAGVSYTVMSEFTGRSTSTLQAWKKEAAQ